MSKQFNCNEAIEFAAEKRGMVLSNRTIAIMQRHEANSKRWSFAFAGADLYAFLDGKMQYLLQKAAA